MIRLRPSFSHKPYLFYHTIPLLLQVLDKILYFLLEKLFEYDILSS